MEYKIINTGDYLLIVDDSEIKEGDWIFSSITKKVYQFIECVHYEYKIITHLPLNNSPILEGVDLLPPIDKIPIGFKCKMNILGRQIIETEKIIVEWQPIPEIDYMPKIKTTTNSQGLTQWIGEYIY